MSQAATETPPEVKRTSFGATGFASAVEGRNIQDFDKRCKAVDNQATGMHGRTSELPGNLQPNNGMTRSQSTLNKPVSGATGFASADEGRNVQDVNKRCKAVDNQATGMHGRRSDLTGNLQPSNGMTRSQSTLNKPVSGATGYASAIEGRFV